MSRYVSEEESMDIAIDSFRMSLPQLAEKYSRKEVTIKRVLLDQIDFINLCRESLHNAKINILLEEATEVQRLRLIDMKKKVVIAQEELDAIQKKSGTNIP